MADCKIIVIALGVFVTLTSCFVPPVKSEYLLHQTRNGFPIGVNNEDRRKISAAGSSHSTDDTRVVGERVITEAPANETVNIGNTHTLRCTSNSSEQLNWYFLSAGATENVAIVRGCNLGPPFVGIYSVDVEGPGSCHLVILKMSEGLAGQYICEESLDFDRTYAYISVPELTAPVNTAQLRGSVVRLNCRRTSTQIAWTFLAVGDTSSVVLAVNCQTVPGHGDNYQVEKSDNACNLIIDGLVETHAGAYTCQDLSSSELPPSAEIVYIVSDPVCTETVLSPPPFNLGSTPVIFSCRIDYIGNISPQMEWDGDKTSGSSSTVSQNTYVEVSSQPTVMAGASFGPFNCTTSFNAPEFDSPPNNHIPDVTPPNYNHIFTSTAYTVLNPDDYPTRLVNNINEQLNEGRLEIYYNGFFGTVCANGWGDSGPSAQNLLNSAVACKAIGNGWTVGVASMSPCPDPGAGQIWLDNVICNGTERSIANCQHDSFGSHSCSHSEDTWLTCA